MKGLFFFISLFASISTSLGCCEADYRTLFERLTTDDQPIFLCKIIKSSTDENHNFISQVRVLEMFFGHVDTGIVTINSGSLNSSAGGTSFPENTTWLIYGGGSGKSFSAGSICDANSKLFLNTREQNFEIETLRKFRVARSGKGSHRIRLSYPNGAPAVTGKFHHGKPVGVWQYYFPNGTPKSKITYNSIGQEDGESELFSYAENDKSKLIERSEIINDNGFFIRSKTYILDGERMYLQKEGQQIKTAIGFNSLLTTYFFSGVKESYSFQENYYVDNCGGTNSKNYQFYQYYPNGHLKEKTSTDELGKRSKEVYDENGSKVE